MFTGIVEELGEFSSLEHQADTAVLTATAGVVVDGTRPGDSIAVNGVCLTVIECGPDFLRADVIPETLARSNLGELRPGDPVNLERAVAAHARLGGHIVQGHVDATATLLGRDPGQNWDAVTIALPESVARYVAEKGSIAVDGVSLTVMAVSDTDFTIGLIPTTLERTTLGRRQVGEAVNLEVDVIAKYVERLTVGAHR